MRNTLPGRAGCLCPASNSSPQGWGRHHLDDDNLCHCFSTYFFPIMTQQVNNQICFPPPCLMSWLPTAPVLHERGEDSFWESFQPEMLCPQCTKDLHIFCQGVCDLTINMPLYPILQLWMGTTLKRTGYSKQAKLARLFKHLELLMGLNCLWL